jgi:hypothetical protein
VISVTRLFAVRSCTTSVSISRYSIRKAVITPSRIGTMLPTYRVASATSWLPDEGGNTRLAFPVGSGCDVPAPDRVVTQPQATNPDAVPRGPPTVRVTVLVHVAVHHVEVARFLREPLERTPTR